MTHSHFEHRLPGCWPGPVPTPVLIPILLAVVMTAMSCSPDDSAPGESLIVSKTIYVSPNDDLQQELDRAADSGVQTVVLRKGTYRPGRAGQTFIVLTKRHDGLIIRAEATDGVVLTASNPELAQPEAASYPAIVNHVILTGNGVSHRTIIDGVTITGANGYADQSAAILHSRYPEFQGNLKPGMFFILDGGAVKVFADSAPQFHNCTIAGNRTQLCGGGVSIEQSYQSVEPVKFRNCVFRDNHCPATGAAVDVLAGGRAEFENCLFVGNIANTGMDEIAKQTGLTYNEKHGCGALTVFPDSRVHVRNCTFTANWNGVDDHGSGSVYENSIFWMNDAWDESRPGKPYELDVFESAVVSGCFIHGQIADLQGTVSPQQNTLGEFDPRFDEQFQPTTSACQTAGYRQVPQTGSPVLTQESVNAEKKDSGRAAGR